MDLQEARRIGQSLITQLEKYCLPKKCLIVGSTRRWAEKPGDLELLCMPDLSKGNPPLEFGKPAYMSYFDEALDKIVQQRIIFPTNKGTLCRKFFISENHVKLQIWVIYDPSIWGVACAVYTGPAEFSKWIVSQRQFGGALPDGHTVRDGWKVIDPQGSQIRFPSEGEFLEFLGLGWVEPKDRRAYMRKF